ncbi:MAG TPA: lipopolysaccharide assembly protein LapA domain-containing protein [Trueperaceae bacterium]
MKAARIVQLLLIVLAAVYLWLFHSANPDYVELPLLRGLVPQLPVGLVVVAALLIGWLVGWVPTRIALWRRAREAARLRAELAQERARAAPEAVPVSPYLTQTEYPVIPDRPRDPALDDPDEAA